MSANLNNTFVISTGSMQVDINEASTDIDDMIDMLRHAKNMGAEFVTLSTDTYGPQFRTVYRTIYNEGDMVSDLDQ